MAIEKVLSISYNRIPKRISHGKGSRMTLKETTKYIDLTPYPRPALLSAEEQEEHCNRLLKYLLKEQGLIAAFNSPYRRRREAIRGLMNRRMPHPIPSDILELQDRLFWTESVERGIVGEEMLPFGKYGIALWQGDITRLKVGAIVNAANSALLGCFTPGHNCIDNAIHSFAGMQLRDDCAKLIAAQDQEEEVGGAKITRAYNLPSAYVLHTVGPMIAGEPSREARSALRSCYISCLNLAEEMGLGSIAFCCISTGVFNFPREEAAEIATGSVLNWKMKTKSPIKVIFNTFLPNDTEIYSNILKIARISE